jgi:hypothetical protein
VLKIWSYITIQIYGPVWNGLIEKKKSSSAYAQSICKRKDTKGLLNYVHVLLTCGMFLEHESLLANPATHKVHMILRSGSTHIELHKI